MYYTFDFYFNFFIVNTYMIVALTQEEQNIVDYLAKQFPNDIYPNIDSKNNVYRYNIQNYTDINPQQQQNMYNLSLGQTSNTSLAQGGSRDIFNDRKEYLYTIYSNIVLKTFEFTIFSVLEENYNVVSFAELIRYSLYSYPNTFNVPAPISTTYTKLDNTDKPLTKCYFTLDVITAESFAFTNNDKISKFDIINTIPLSNTFPIFK